MSAADKVKQIIAGQLKINLEDIKYESNLAEDLDVDSLDAVELVMALEDEFGFEIPDEDAYSMTTVGEMIKYIEEKIK